MREELDGAVDSASLNVLVMRASAAAFRDVRTRVHELDMAAELIAAGCTELRAGASVLGFSLALHKG